MSRLIAAAVIGVLVSSAGLTTGAFAQDCSHLLPVKLPKTEGVRRIVAKDLIELREVGDYGPQTADTQMLAVSPQGDRVAFQLRQANVDSNMYCQGMAILDIKTRKAALVDRGGAFIPWMGSVHGFAEYVTPGMPTTIVPQWSPDGREIAYLRRDAGVTQLWLADADGAIARPVTQTPFDVNDFKWVDADHLVFAGRPSLSDAKQNIEEEGRTGFRYDDRWAPVLSNRPFVREPIASAFFVVDISTGMTRPAADVTGLALSAPASTGKHQNARMSAAGDNDLEAWVEMKDPKRLKSTTILHVERPTLGERICASDACQHIVALWVSPDGRSVWFQSREGWAESTTAFYVWRAGQGHPVKTIKTDDVIAGCVPDKEGLVCTREGSTTPRHIIQLDPEAGAITTVLDLNPEFQNVILGDVERLHWKNKLGIEGFGDLVLPHDYPVGTKLPLIIVQYQTRGFLRGGTGNEYPIQMFADRGFAVLSFDKPLSVSVLAGATDWNEASRLDRIDWVDRRSIQSSIETGIDMLVKRGIVDPDRIGLTGLSDGSSTVQFWLINGRPLAAAAMSTCCADPSVTGFLDGPVVGRIFAAMGYPAVGRPDDTIWSQVSIRMNAVRINTPLLMQLPDHEYLGALEAYTALKEAGKCVEMYVFPDEYHLKIQPVHRLAIYKRNLAWFDRWLKPEPDASDGHTSCAGPAGR